MHLECYDYNSCIMLSDLVIQDLKWWRDALKYLNGIPLTWVFSDPTVFHEEIWTDAALRGDLKLGGMGGCTRSGTAYQLDNRQTTAYYVSRVRKGVDIKLMELLAIYVLVAYMAPTWKHKNIKMFCDNPTAVTSIVKKRGPLIRRDLHHIVNKICLLSAQYQFRFWIELMEGDKNVMADRLSRFKQLYIHHQIDPQEFVYVHPRQMKRLANDMFAELLNFRLVPRNDDDQNY